MKSKVIQTISRLLVVTLTLLSMQAAQAGMIGADQVIASASGQLDRPALIKVISRTDVSDQLQAMGLEPQVAKDRVAVMSDDEVRTLAGKLNTLPAGASGDWGWGLAAVIIIAAIIYWAYGWKK